MRLPPLKGVAKKKLTALIDDANREIAKMSIESLDHLNDIAYATARSITLKLGLTVEQRVKKEPAWRRRILTKISKLRRDLSQVESWKMEELKNVAVKQRLDRLYKINAKGSRQAARAPG